MSAQLFSNFITFLFLSVVCVSNAVAKDVYIKGYNRSDGTYVSPHIRSTPDKYRYNNYGPSRHRNELMNPRARDNDRDGISNYKDTDDDNDGVHDDYDRSQY